MIYRVLSEPCVYISLPHGADDFGTGVPDSRGTLSRYRFGTPHSYNTTACAWRGVRVDHKLRPSLASVFRSDLCKIHAVSLR